MKIAFLSDGIYPYEIGGMQQFSSSIVKEFVKSNHKVDLFHFVKNRKELPSELDVNNLFFDSNYTFNNIFCCHFPNSIYFPGHYIYNSYKYSKWIYKILKSDIDSYDLIYSQGFSSWKLLIEHKRNFFNTKIAINFHGYEMFQLAPNFKVKLEFLLLKPFVKWITKNSDIVFSLGGGVNKILKSLDVNENKIVQSFNGISRKFIVDNVRIKSNSRLKILFIGRNERRKGYKELCNAINMNNYKPVDFHFIGPFIKSDQITSSFHSIKYHGLVDDINIKKDIIDNCDVLICPSFSEGMPTVILEGMSRGLAIIATDVGSVSLLVNEKNGVLIKNLSPKSINESIYYIQTLENENLLKLKLCSIEKLKLNYTWEAIMSVFYDNLKKHI